MSKNNSVVPQARAALDQFKMEAAREVGVQSLINEIIQHIVQPMAIKSI
ncbi:MAG: small, acid-soluble spore protein, alpha/beta type [Clostridia bacterium]|nr:small, acid-soluble spore protein, alpha/beta type [Clostridia bacterium]